MAHGGTRDAIVVGGGISGLACLWKLVGQGIDAELAEASPRIGGAIRTRREGAYLIEEGPNTVLGTPDLLALIEEVGLGGDVLEADPRLPRYVFFRAELHPAPLGPLALLGTRLLSASGKLRLLREPWIARRKDDSEESIRDFFVRRFGPELHDVLVAPLVSGTFAGDTKRLSVSASFPTVAELERRHGSVVRGFLFRRRSGVRRPRLISLRDGLETLPARIGERLRDRIRLESKVVGAVRASDGTFELTLAGSDASLRARSIVSAADAAGAEAVFRHLAADAVGPLAEIEHPPLVSVSLAYARADVPHDLRGFGFLVPRDQGVRLLGCIFASSLFPGRGPSDGAALTAFVGGATDPDAADAEGSVALVREGFRQTLGITAEPVRVLALRRYDRAIPQYGFGHVARVARIRAAIGRAPGLFVTGNFLEGISVGECIRMANATADDVTAFLREPQHKPNGRVDFSDRSG